MKKLIIFLLLVTAARAASISASGGGASTTLNYTVEHGTYNISGTVYHARILYSCSITTANLSQGAGAAEVYTTTGSGGPAGTRFFNYNASPTGVGTTSGYWYFQGGEWIILYAYVITQPGNVAVPLNYGKTYFQIPEAPPVFYKITVTFPANETNHIVRY